MTARPQRKLRRSEREGAQRNLRLVPGPKRRRRRLRWPTFRWSYKRAHELHRHEERVVLTVLRERGGLGSAASWNDHEPTRWDVGYLDKTFKRLSARGYVHAAGRDMFRPRRHGMRYELTGLGRDALEKGRL